jgi:hypothetical protein
MKRTEQEIETMIGKLNSLKSKLPKYSVFGDDNWSAIDYAVDAIKYEWDEDEIYEKDLSHNEESMALCAIQWLNGEIEEDELL